MVLPRQPAGIQQGGSITYETEQNHRIVSRRARRPALRQPAQDRGEEFVKVIFTGSQWREYKEPNWPYRVMGSALPCVLITRSAARTTSSNARCRRIPTAVPASCWSTTANGSP